MIRRLSALWLFGLCAALSLPAQAFTPESGWWWNPDEPGVGYNIEIQDNYMFVAAYTYQATGNPRAATFFTAQGLMQNNNTFTTSEVNTFQNGTCPTCGTYTAPQTVPATGALRPLRIEFDTETTAVLNWGGFDVPIERFDFYLSRDTAANSQISPKTELMLGEWQVVLDFYDFDENRDFPYFGDVLVFDQLAINDGGPTDFYDGCRPEHSTLNPPQCTSAALANHDASGFYAENWGTNLIIVKDGFVEAWNENAFLVFEVNVGTYQFDGYAKLCRASHTGANVGDACLDNHAQYPEIPVRGWRTASRAFVQGNASAPFSATPRAKNEAAPTEGPVLSRFNAMLAKQSTSSTAQTTAPVRERAKSEEITAQVQQAVARILARSEAAGAE